MNTVLVISYFYPPYDTTAALEASKLTCYLEEFGWSPVILAAENDYLPTLPVEVHESRVHRTKQIDVNRLPKQILQKNNDVYTAHVEGGKSRKALMATALGRGYRQAINFPDAQIGWLPYALAQGRRIMTASRPDLVFSMGGPFTGHLVAERLVRASTVPWLADFRDLWTDNHYFHRARPLSWVERRLESRTIGRATGLSTATPAWAELLQRRFRKPTWVIPNGYEPRATPPPTPASDRFVLTYTGVYYNKGQDISPLLHALGSLQREGFIGPSNFELRLVGRFLRSAAAEVSRQDLDDMVTFEEVVPHDRALALQTESAALLFLLWEPTPQGRGWLSAKMYEYMAAGRPILAVGSKQVDAARFVTSVDAGRVASEPSEIAAVLREWIETWRKEGRVPCEPNRDELRKYEWREITKELVGAFDQLTQSGPKP